jgi:glycoside/pentoside/hexuronide:cation symporter, GPH family
VLLWWRPPLANGLALAAYYGLAYLLLDTAATFVYMPYFALTPELTLDYDERTSLTSYRMLFSIVAGLVGYVVPGMIIGAMRPEHAGRVLLMGLAFGAASALPLIGTFLGTRERPEFAHQEQSSLREAVRAIRHNQPFLFAVGIYLLTWMTVELLQPMLLYFLKYWLGLEGQADVILGTIFVVAALALPLWDWATHHWNKRLAYIMGIAFLAVVLCVIAFIRPGAPLPLVIVLAGLAGIGVSAAHVLPWSIIPDAIEWDELATGKRHEGAFYSLVTLMHKVAASLVVPGAMLLLKWSGYVPNAATQAPRVQTAIRFMVGGAPAVLLMGGIVFAALYPLDREKHRQVREELARRRAANTSL